MTATGRVFYRVMGFLEDYVWRDEVERMDYPPPPDFLPYAMFGITLVCLVNVMILSYLSYESDRGIRERIVDVMDQSQIGDIVGRLLESDLIRHSVEHLLAGVSYVAMGAISLRLLRAVFVNLGRWGDHSRKVAREKSDRAYNKMREDEDREEKSRRRQNEFLILRQKAEVESESAKMAKMIRTVMENLPTHAAAPAAALGQQPIPQRPPQAGDLVQFIAPPKMGELILKHNGFLPVKIGDLVKIESVSTDGCFTYKSGDAVWTSSLDRVTLIA